MLKDWDPLFNEVKNKEYSKSLKKFLNEEYENEAIFPPRDMVFQAFKYTSPQTLKAVIIGQDPYHNPGEAMGLSFSVPLGMDLPPSLINIYKEIEDDLKIKMNYRKGDLTPWAKQGVLLLNAYLTVRAHQPLSHKRTEYQAFIKDVLQYIEKQDQAIVYMLWGNFAKQYKPLITNPHHLVLESAHPSPLSANRGGWFKKKLFSKCNDFLIENGRESIDWTIK